MTQWVSERLTNSDCDKRGGDVVDLSAVFRERRASGCIGDRLFGWIGPKNYL